MLVGFPVWPYLVVANDVPLLAATWIVELARGAASIAGWLLKVNLPASIPSASVSMITST
jgi:hypothetical protein